GQLPVPFRRREHSPSTVSLRGGERSTAFPLRPCRATPFRAANGLKAATASGSTVPPACREGTVSVAVGPDDFLSAIPGRQRTVRTTGKIFPTGRPTGRELLLPHPPVVLSGSLTPRMQGVASVLARHEIPRPHQPVFLRPVAT